MLEGLIRRAAVRKLRRFLFELPLDFSPFAKQLLLAGEHDAVSRRDRRANPMASRMRENSMRSDALSYLIDRGKRETAGFSSIAVFLFRCVRRAYGQLCATSLWEGQMEDKYFSRLGDALLSDGISLVSPSFFSSSISDKDDCDGMEEIN